MWLKRREELRELVGKLKVTCSDAMREYVSGPAAPPNKSPKSKPKRLPGLAQLSQKNLAKLNSMTLGYGSFCNPRRRPPTDAGFSQNYDVVIRGETIARRQWNA